jgi:hypothetical protein
MRGEAPEESMSWSKSLPIRLSRLARNVAIPASVLTLAACGGGSNVKSDIGPPPTTFQGFPAESWKASETRQAFVNVEAAYVTNHEDVLGVDLTEDGLLPIRLTLGLRGNEMTNAQIRLDSDQMDMRLYLPDGTVLVPVTTKRAVELAGSKGTAVGERAIEAGVLPEYETARANPRFAYFDLATKSYDFEGANYSFTSRGVSKTVDISKSLLAFNVMIENKLEPFYVGIRAQ